MRIPPTEKRGRVHTSSISVAMVNEMSEHIDLDMKDITRYYTKGSGCGGQHKNKVETCVVLVHNPTGIRVMNQNSRSKIKNEELAWKELKKRLEEKKRSENSIEKRDSIRDQIGMEGRGKKRRTYRMVDQTVVDHKSGKKLKMKDVWRGKLDRLH